MQKTKKFRLHAALMSALVIFSISGQVFSKAKAEVNYFIPQSVFLNIPYTSQAPLGEWSDTRQEFGCEEASILMAAMWVWGKSVPPEEIKREIIDMSAYEQAFFGFYYDTSADDTAKLMQDYFTYTSTAATATVQKNISTADIKQQLAAGNLLVIPLNTRLLNSPLHKYGPLRHTVVITGYDQSQGKIYIHDPFYSSAQNYAVSETALNNALWDYTSGTNLPLPTRTTAMIVVSKAQ